MHTTDAQPPRLPPRPAPAPTPTPTLDALPVVRLDSRTALEDAPTRQAQLHATVRALRALVAALGLVALASGATWAWVL